VRDDVDVEQKKRLARHRFLEISAMAEAREAFIGGVLVELRARQVETPSETQISHETIIFKTETVGHDKIPCRLMIEVPISDDTPHISSFFYNTLK